MVFFLAIGKRPQYSVSDDAESDDTPAVWVSRDAGATWERSLGGGGWRVEILSAGDVIVAAPTLAVVEEAGAQKKP